MSHSDQPTSQSTERTETPAGGNGNGAPADAIQERLGTLRLEKSHFAPTPPAADAASSPRRWVVPSVAVAVLLLLVFFGRSFFSPAGAGQRPAAGTSSSTSAPDVIAVTAVSNEGSDGPRLSVSGYVVAESKVQVPVKVTGTVVELPIVEGTKVSVGDLLVRLDSKSHEFDLEEVRGSMKIAEARLAELKEGTRNEDLEQMRANVEQAEAHRDNAKTQLERAEKLAGSLAASEIDSAKTNLREAAAHLKQLSFALQSSEAGARREQIAAAEGEVERARAVMDKAQYLLDCTRVVAEIDGTVLQKFVEPGESIKVDPATGTAAVCVLANLNHLLAEVEVHERDLEHVDVGQHCWVSPEAAPELIYEARVERRSPVVNRQRGSVQVKVRILEPDDKLMPDMSCKVTFLTGSGSANESVEVPQGAVVTQGSSPVIFVLDGDVARERAVTVGKTRDQMIEIASGLRAGEKVLLSQQPLVDGQSVHLRVR